MPPLWQLAALGGLLWLVGKRYRVPGTGGGLMSQYYKAPDGRCMFAPVGQAHYAISCEEWELGVAAEQEEFLNGGN